ncbi:MAG: 30S ribosomal protein S20 [Dehalococcoidia bacterium]
MANTSSAKKRVRRNLSRYQRNRAIRSQYKTYVNKARKELKNNDLESAEKAVGEAIRVLDKTVRKGILHRNNAARRKSSLVRALDAARSGN